VSLTIGPLPMVFRGAATCPSLAAQISHAEKTKPRSAALR
jgi:hypothetical protein